MMRTGKQQNTQDAMSYDSGVVIVAQIAFAALLLYLTNHPLDLKDLTQTQLLASSPGVIDNPAMANSAIAAPTVASNSAIETSSITSGFLAPTAKVASASTVIDTAAIELQINN